MKTIICIDRDGTIIYDDKYFLGRTNSWKSKIKFLPGVIKGLKLLNSLKNVSIYMISNQTGIAIKDFKLLTSKRADLVCKEIISILKQKGVKIDGFINCPYVDKKYLKKRPSRKFIPSLVKDSACRKPKPGMIYEALKRESVSKKQANVYVIGDRFSDVKAALNAKSYGIYVPFKNEAKEFEKVKQLIQSTKNKQVKSKQTKNKQSKQKNAKKIYMAKDFLDAAKHILETETKRKIIYGKKQDLEKKAVTLIENKVKSLLKQKKQAGLKQEIVLGIPGGKSVIGVFKKLKKAKIDWSKIQIFMLDERMVPITSKDSNYKLAYDNFISFLIKTKKLPLHNVHPFILNKKSKDYGLKDYVNNFKKHAKKIDLLLLSSGADGHIASLFPKKISNLKGKYFSLLKNSPKKPKLRMTVTKSLLLQADFAILLIFDPVKKNALTNLLDKNLNYNDCPEKLVLLLPEHHILSNIKLQ